MEMPQGGTGQFTLQAAHAAYPREHFTLQAGHTAHPGDHFT